MSKKNEGKYKPSLVYTSLLKEISSVREYGIEKYGSGEDWLTTEPIKHLEACIRHVRAFMDKEHFDQESGIHHLAHAASNLMFEIERMYRQQDASQTQNKKTSSQMLNLGDYLLGKKS
jgi:hypothetical protein